MRYLKAVQSNIKSFQTIQRKALRDVTQTALDYIKNQPETPAACHFTFHVTSAWRCRTGHWWRFCPRSWRPIVSVLLWIKGCCQSRSPLCRRTQSRDLATSSRGEEFVLTYIITFGESWDLALWNNLGPVFTCCQHVSHMILHLIPLRSYWDIEEMSCVAFLMWKPCGYPNSRCQYCTVLRGSAMNHSFNSYFLHAWTKAKLKFHGFFKAACNWRKV